MNDPKNSIQVDQSSLLSLKAELLKKQSEVMRIKKSSDSTEILFPKLKNKIKIPKSNAVKKDEATGAKVCEFDDSSDKVKRMLEMKAKYYDKMEKSGQNTTLILFKNRAVNEDPVKSQKDFVEFTDIFGRTRTVKRDELDDIKQRDEEISDTVDQRSSSSHKEFNESRERERIVEEEDANEEIGANFLKQREEWRKQEQMNMERSEIHYQDVLFSEARMHGTAYYEFSTDHDERIKQQKNFEQLRKQTEEAQSQRNSMKKQRDEIIKNRVKLAKIRMRQKLGLPIEDENNEEQNDVSNDDNVNKEKELEKRLEDEKKEAERDLERKRHVRPWDKGKSGDIKKSADESDEWMPKREKFLMTQEEWNEKQREKRDNTFAPVYDSNQKSNKSSSNIEDSIAANLKFIRKNVDRKK